MNKESNTNSSLFFVATVTSPTTSIVVRNQQRYILFRPPQPLSPPLSPSSATTQSFVRCCCSFNCLLPASVTSVVFSSIFFASQNLVGPLSFTGADFAGDPNLAGMDSLLQTPSPLLSNGLSSLKLQWNLHVITTVEAPQQSSLQDTMAFSCSHLWILLILPSNSLHDKTEGGY
ncbi:hypothetical protein LXL04_025160 [Taraxacum kok-saghyz]